MLLYIVSPVPSEHLHMQDSIADTCLANQAFLKIPQLIELEELTQNTIILLFAYVFLDSVQVSEIFKLEDMGPEFANVYTTLFLKM